MSKDELIDLVQEAAGLDTKAMAQRAVEAIFDAIAKDLVKGKSFAYPKFGSFVVKPTAARTGVNPKTGAKIQIKASKKVSFKVSSVLKAAVKAS